MKLYVHEPSPHAPNDWQLGRIREASPAEILSAARPHADLEAAAQAIAGLDRETWEAWLEKAAYPDPNMAATVRWHRERARAALDAALGADNEEENS